MLRLLEGTRRRAVFLVGGFLLGGCEDAIYGNGERITETRSLTGFDRVESAGSVDVHVEQGGAFEVSLSIDSNVMPELRTRVIDTVLVIDSDVDFEDLVPGPHVVVTLPDLRGVSASGSGASRVVASRTNERIELALSGSGALQFDGTASAARVRLEGSGDVTLFGTTDSLELGLDGSGDINAGQFEAAHGVIVLAGSGSIRANLSQSAEVDLSGSGDVYVYGDAVLTRVSIDGSGQLHAP